ncbi:MAG: response regulator transcription factor [Bryobacteraceae bacterium]|nr:response regulator transcription factor [Bryobacteraceae bacterium]
MKELRLLSIARQGLETPEHSKMHTRLILVDDHRIMRDGIKAMLSQHSEEFVIVGEAETGDDALRMARELRPDVMLVDIGLPGLSGIEVTVEIQRHCPEVRVIVLSMYGDESAIVAAVRSGAKAFLVKSASKLDLMTALRTVSRGGSYLSPTASAKLLSRLQKQNDAQDGMPEELAALSPRELQILRLVAEGKSSKEVALLLNLSLETVRSYRKSMMKKLQVNNAAGVTQLALTHGLTRLQHPPGAMAAQTH